MSESSGWTLLVDLESPHESTRRDALVQLAQRPTSSSTDPAHATARLAALRRVARLDPSPAVRAAAEQLISSPDAIRAADARERVGSAPDAPDSPLVANGTDSADDASGAAGDAEPEETTQALLESADQHVRAQAARTLIARPDAAATPLLASLVATEQDPFYLSALMLALAKCGRGDHAELIEHHLGSASPRTRSAAVEALEATEDADLLESVRPLLGDPHHRVRGAAAAALRDLERHAAVACLDRMLVDTEEVVLRAALYALRFFDGPTALPRLRDTLGAEALGPRTMALASLNHMASQGSIAARQLLALSSSGPPVPLTNHAGPPAGDPGAAALRGPPSRIVPLYPHASAAAASAQEARASGVVIPGTPGSAGTTERSAPGTKFPATAPVPEAHGQATNTTGEPAHAANIIGNAAHSTKIVDSAALAAGLSATNPLPAARTAPLAHEVPTATTGAGELSEGQDAAQLRAMLASPQASVRGRALNALVGGQVEGRFELLRDYFRVELHPHLYEPCADALARAAALGAPGELERMVGQLPEGARRQALKAAGRRVAEGGEAVSVAVSRFEGAGREEVAALRRELRRAAAVDAVVLLESAAEGEVHELVLPLARATDRRQRLVAVEALGGARGLEVEEALAELVGDMDADVSLAACERLARMAPGAAREAIQDFVASGQPDAARRGRAMMSLLPAGKPQREQVRLGPPVGEPGAGAWIAVALVVVVLLSVALWLR